MSSPDFVQTLTGCLTIIACVFNLVTLLIQGFLGANVIYTFIINSRLIKKICDLTQYFFCYKSRFHC